MTTTSILHLSDLHFGPFYSPAAGEAALSFAREQRADVIVVSGDFTQRAKRAQFEEARRFLEELPVGPRIVVPGNHDIPLYRVFERLLTPYALYREHIDDTLDYRRDIAGVSFVALNSTAPLTKITNGRLTEAQIRFCAEAFKDAPPANARVVVAHHHFAPAPDFERSEVLPGAKRALDAFVNLDVDMILGGHLHRSYIGNSLDVYAGKRRDRGVTIVQCGTTTSQRGRGKEREKNSLNMIFIERTQVRIVHYLFLQGAGNRFAPISEHRFPRRGTLSLDSPGAEEPAGKQEQPGTLGES